ncbi:tetratricopeptide repeat protein [Haliangium sp.]|uniref:tetratricopeptide repeat protein n=1 Tax=Haliangium sp. TaxID=2663208 RepID=UPI003D0BA79A
MALTRRELYGWLQVESLVLEVPGEGEPAPPGTPPERYQRRRTELRAAALQVAQQGLPGLLAGRAEALAGLGVSGLAAYCRDGYVALGGRVARGGYEADFGCRVYFTGSGDEVVALVGRPRVYGFAPVSAPVLVHQVMAAVLGVSGPGPGAAAAPASDARTSARERPRVVGLGRFAFEPLQWLLWTLMPAAGWRLPRLSDVGPTSLGVRRGGIRVAYTRMAGQRVAALRADAAAANLDQALVGVRDGDELLRAGDVVGAVQAYRAGLSSGGPESLLCERLLAVYAADPERFDDGRGLAQEQLARATGAAPALVALAAIELHGGARGEAAGRYERLADVAEAEGDIDAAVAAALAAARLVHSEDAAAASRLYERVVARRPEHPEAGAALTHHYTEGGHWRELVALLRRRIDASPDPMQAVPAQVHLARLLFRELGDIDGARTELERARRIDPVHIPALALQAELELAAGSPRAALDRLGHVANLWLRQGDEQAAARAFAQVGGLWLGEGAVDEAETAYREALSLLPDDPEGLHGAAVVAARRGEHDTAARLWARLSERSEIASPDRARYRFEQGCSLLAAGDPEAAEAALTEAALSMQGPVSAEAQQMLAEIAQDGRDPEQALAALAAAIDALSNGARSEDARSEGDPRRWPHELPSDVDAGLRRAVELAQRRAQLMDALDRSDQARADDLRAHALARKLGPASACAAALAALDAERRRGDISARRRLLDALLDGAAGAEKIELMLARAELFAHGVGPVRSGGEAGSGALAGPDPAGAHDAALADLGEALAEGGASQAQRLRGLRLRAEILGAVGDQAGRAQALTECVGLVSGTPAHAAAEAAAAEAWLAAGAVETALKSAKLALEGMGPGADGVAVRRLRTVLGEAAWRRQSWPDVIEAYAPLIAAGDDVEPEIEPGQRAQRLGRAFEAQGDYTAAALAFGRGVSAPSTPLVQRLDNQRAMARALEYAGTLGEAAAAFEDLARVIVAEAEGNPREGADAWYRAGDLWKRHGEAEEAERCFESALHVAKDHLPALDALEALEREQGDYEQLAAVLNRKLTVTAGHPQRQKALLLRLAELQAQELGRNEDAAESWQRVLEIDPDSRAALAPLAAHEWSQGNVAAAAAMFLRLAGPLGAESEPPRGVTPAVDRPAPADGVMKDRIAAATALVELSENSPDQRALVDSAVSELLALLPGHPGLLALRERLAAPAPAAVDVAAPETGERAASDEPEVAEAREAVSEPEAVAEVPEAASEPAAADAREVASEPEVVDAREAAGPSVSSEGDDAGRPAVGSGPGRAGGEAAAAAAPTVADGGDVDLRARADAALAAGEAEQAARHLEALAARLPEGTGPGQARQRTRRAEIFLELADLYYDQLGDRVRARQAMRTAAEAYGSGSRHDATLRMLAAEATSAQADDEAIAAYEAIPRERRTVADRVNQAAAYLRVGRSRDAAEELDALDREGSLTDEGAVLLFGLNQARRAQAERAQALEQAARRSSPPVAAQRLEEALELYRGVLADSEGEARVRAAQAALAARAQASTEASGRARRKTSEIPLPPPLSGIPLPAPATQGGWGLPLPAPKDQAAGGAGEVPEATPHPIDDSDETTEPISPGPPPRGDVEPMPEVVQTRRRRVRKTFGQTTLGVPPAGPNAPSTPLTTLPRPRVPAPSRPVQTSSSEIELVIPAAVERLGTEPDNSSEPRTTMPMGTPVAPPPGSPAMPSLPARPAGKRRRSSRITQPGVITPLRTKNSRATITYPGVELDIRKLENSAIASNDPARAADLLAQSLTLRTGRLSRHDQPLDDDARAVLSRLRDVTKKSGKVRLLVHGLEAAAAVGGDPETRAGLLSEAAELLQESIGDEAHAARLLTRALEATPADAALLARLTRVLRKRGEALRLIEVYQLHLGALDGPGRARPLYELGCLYRDVLDDPKRAAACFARAHETDPSFVDAWLPLANARLAEGDAAAARRLYDLVLSQGAPDPETRDWILSRLAAIEGDGDGAASTSQPLPARRRPGPTVIHAAGGTPRQAESRVEESLRRAAELESRGRPDAALVHYRVAAEHDPGDQRPLDALERLHQARAAVPAYADLLADLAETAAEAHARARLHLRRGRVLRDHLGREADAYRCFKLAHACDPDDGEIAHELRRVAMERGEWTMAADLLQREIAAAPTTTTAARLEMDLAVLYDEKLLDADKARVHYEQALSLDPALPGPPRPLARLYELAGHHAEAAHMNELAAQHARDDSQRSRLLYRAAVSAERTGNVPAARRLYHLAALAAPAGEDASASHRALVRLDDRSEGARRELLELELREAADDEQRIDILRQLLARATTTGDRAAADRHARSLLDMDGADLSAYLVLKSQAEATQDWTALASLLNARAVSLTDRDERAAVYYDLGRLYQHRLHDPDGATRSFERALAADPRHPAALEALAELAFDSRDWGRARQLYARIRPESCATPVEEIAYRRGVIAETLGHQREAMESYARAVEALPAHVDAQRALQRLALDSGDLERAIAASQALLELMPGSEVAALSRARLHLAELCERAGDLDAAVEYAEMVVSEEPGSQPALDMLARLSEDRGDYEASARVLRRLIGLASTPTQRAALQHRLGELYLNRFDDRDQAADAYLKAVDLDPQHVPTLRRLLDYYWDEGNLVELAEIAQALAEQAALIDEDSSPLTLTRVLIALAPSGDEAVLRLLIHRLGGGLPELLSSTLADVLRRGDQAGDVPGLARTAVRICALAPQLSAVALAERLSTLGPVCMPLALAVRTAPRA